MHNHHHQQQQHLTTNNIISKLSVIVLSIVLLTGLTLVPALQIGVNGQVQRQQQAPQQQKQVGLSQIIKQIAQQVSNANPGTNATQVQQILVQLAKQTAKTSSQAEAIKEIREIYSQVNAYPFGPLSQVLSHFAQQVASGSSNVVQIVQQTVQDKASSSGSKNITQALSSTAVQQASGGSKNVNQVIRQAAQILANRAGVSVEKVEAVIIQMALQISQAQGKAITGQSILQIANQITQNPNGVLAQAILKLVNQDDGGKSSHTTTIIKNVVKSSSRGGGGGVNICNGIANCIVKLTPDPKPEPVPGPTPIQGPAEGTLPLLPPEGGGEVVDDPELGEGEEIPDLDDAIGDTTEDPVDDIDGELLGNGESDADGGEDAVEPDDESEISADDEADDSDADGGDGDGGGDEDQQADSKQYLRILLIVIFPDILNG